jgi:hypothetical protein
MKETLASRMAEAIDIQTLQEMAVSRVAAMFPYGTSTDGMDYAYASAQCLAEIMDIIRNNYDDVQSGLASWLSTDPMEWYASDGDIRFDLDELVQDENLAKEWNQMVEESWDLD